MADGDRHVEVTYAPDVVPRGLVLSILMWMLFISVALCVLAYLLLLVRESQLRPDGVFPEAQLGPPHEVARVRAAPFEVPEAQPRLKEQQRARLDGYSWVDREQRLVRIPVKRAVELLLREEGQP